MKNKWLLIALCVAIFGIGVLVLRSCNQQSSEVGIKDQLNSDGVRSDVAQAIAHTFPESEKKRAAATQLARAFQMAIENPERALEINNNWEKAQACVYAIEGTGPADSATNTGDIIESLVVNSSKRSRAYIRYNANLSGHIFNVIGADLSACSFDPSKMRN